MLKYAFHRADAAHDAGRGIESVLLPDGTRALVLDQEIYQDALRAADAEMSKAVMRLKVQGERARGKQAA